MVFKIEKRRLIRRCRPKSSLAIKDSLSLRENCTPLVVLDGFVDKFSGLPVLVSLTCI